MGIVISVIALMGMLGLVFGLVIAVANKKLAVEMQPLIHIVEDILPKGQCGACGYAGCQAYAEAVVLDKNVPPNLCTPGKLEVATKVAELTGKKANAMESKIASVQCLNPMRTAKKKYKYIGINDCVAESLLHFGEKDCNYGCIGLGTCVAHCPFHAIKLGEDFLPYIESSLCTGCGMCASACPKKIIKMMPLKAPVKVNCSSCDKGASAKKHCDTPCIGCGLCAKACPYEAIKVENNLAIIDEKICLEKCDNAVCVDKCPTKVLRKQC